MHDTFHYWKQYLGQLAFTKFTLFFLDCHTACLSSFSNTVESTSCHFPEWSTDNRPTVLSAEGFKQSCSQYCNELVFKHWRKQSILYVVMSNCTTPYSGFQARGDTTGSSQVMEDKQSLFSTKRSVKTILNKYFIMLCQLNKCL